MDRHVVTKLKRWRDSPYRKPLLIRGARQVGKTWIIRELGAKHFRKAHYISFDRATQVESLFSESPASRETIKALEFLLVRNGGVIPVEVKSGTRARSHSLIAFCQKYDSALKVKLTARNLDRRSEGYHNYPLYLASRLQGIPRFAH